MTRKTTKAATKAVTKKKVMKSSLSNKYVKLTKGIYKVSHKYIVRIQMNGVRKYASFNSLNTAKSFYRSMTK